MMMMMNACMEGYSLKSGMNMKLFWLWNFHVACVCVGLDDENSLSLSSMARMVLLLSSILSRLRAFMADILACSMAAIPPSVLVSNKVDASRFSLSYTHQYFSIEHGPCNVVLVEYHVTTI